VRCSGGVTILGCERTGNGSGGIRIREGSADVLEGPRDSHNGWTNFLEPVSAVPRSHCFLPFTHCSVLSSLPSLDHTCFVP